MLVMLVVEVMSNEMIGSGYPRFSILIIKEAKGETEFINRN